MVHPAQSLALVDTLAHLAVGLQTAQRLGFRAAENHPGLVALRVGQTGGFRAVENHLGPVALRAGRTGGHPEAEIAAPRREARQMALPQGRLVGESPPGARPQAT